MNGNKPVLKKSITKAKSALPIVILSTADMDASVWTNKQHIAVRLAQDSTVHYIESLGLRSPKFTLSDIGRIFKRLKIIFSDKNNSDSINGNLNDVIIHSTILIPFHGLIFFRHVNRIILSWFLMSRIPDSYNLWTFSPLTYGLEKKAKKVIYHSVDLLHTVPGIPRSAILEAEKNLIAIADTTIASSTGVANHLQSQGAQPLLWENVADIGLFRDARMPVRERRVIFVGNLTPSKVDFELLIALSSNKIRVVLAGPSSIDGSNDESMLKQLLESPYVEYLGVLSQRQMARELGKSSVGIIPYKINDYTSGVFPMKVYEYLAAGLPVVATQLPSLAGKNIAGLSIVDRQRFISLTSELYNREYRELDSDYSDNSWTSRIAQIRTLLEEGASAP